MHRYVSIVYLHCVSLLRGRGPLIEVGARVSKKWPAAMTNTVQSREKTGPKQLRNPRIPFESGKIGRYELMFPIDMGGMAAVYAARLAGMAGFEKLCAVKVIYPHLATDESFVRMFFDEARIAAGIRHPNVGEILEVGEDQGYYFMAMELIEGQSLYSLTKKTQGNEIILEPEIYADLLAKVCRGLHDAHEATDANGEPLGLVHRDITPKNILISYRGDVKLIDFGVAWAHGRLTHTRAGAAKGKIGYMSPEYVRGESLDRRADIFALGVVLYTTCTGTHPFPGKTEGERIEKLLKKKLSLPREAAPHLPVELERIIMRAMDYDPDKRFPNAKEMAEELEAFVRERQTTVGPSILSELMEWLFEEEREEQREKIRAHRRSVSMDAPTGYMDCEGGSKSSELASSDNRDIFASTPLPIPEKGTPFESVADEKERPPAFRWKLLLSGALLGCAVAAVSLFLSGVFDPFVVPESIREFPAGASATASAPGPTQPLPRLPEKYSGPEEIEEAPAEDPPETKIISIGLKLQPTDAEVSLDGVPMQAGTRLIKLKGDGISHTVEVTKEDHLPQRITFTADEDQDFELFLKNVPGTGKRRSGRDRGSRAGHKSKSEPKIKMLDNPFM